MTQDNNGQNPADLLHTTNLLKSERPRMSALRLDEIEQGLLRKQAQRGRRAIGPLPLRRRIMALSMFGSLVILSTSSAAAQALNWVSGGTLGKTLGVTGKTQGTSFLFGAYHFGGDSSDDAGKKTYCPRDKHTDSSDDKYSKNSSKQTGKSGVTIKSGKHGGGGESSSSDRCSSSSSSDDRKGGGKGDKDHSDKDHSDKDDKYDKGGKNGKDGKDGKDDKYGGKGGKSGKG